MNRAEIIELSNRIAGNAKEAYIAVTDETGGPTVSTVSVVRTDGICRTWFATSLGANKARRLKACPKAGICFHVGDDNVTLAGEARILTDPQIKKELWQDWFINHFPGGPEDPEYCIIEFTAKRASLWVKGQGDEFSMEDVLKVQSRCGLLCSACSFREPCSCGGCIETNGNPFHGECPVAACCQDKGFTHCGECPDMPCEKLYAYSCLDEENGDKPAGARLSMLRCWNNYA